MRRCSAGVGLAVLCCATLVPGCSRSSTPDRTQEEESAIPVAARAAEIGSIRTVVRARGVVMPAEGAEFLALAPETARVIEVTKAEGAAVAAGELLARFDLPSASQGVARSRAELAGAEAQLESARVAQTRTRDFVSRGLIPRVDLDAAERALADAQAAVERAQAAEAAAVAAASRATVLAPFDGVVAQRFHGPGDIVQGTVTDPVLRIVDPRRLEVSASIPAMDVSRVAPGATARVTSPVDGRAIRLTVTPRASAAQPRADGSVPVRLEFAEAHDVPVDSNVDVEVDAEERSGIVFVTPEAIVRRGDEAVVFVVNGDRAERRVVATGLSDDQRVEITSGLSAGDLVITQGQIGLSDGARINPAISR